ncbi:DUF6318 family protein [Modestobacter marinus]|uniref:DUF6318 family protein n=1 Tax=Modestobacter marinus TaxID=477641 RepID=UPI001C989444|nr:DUF6318 family protein [Modestobacter marinus]
MRLVRAAAAAVAGVALLAGCSEGRQANETLPSTSSTAAESSEALQPLGPPDFPMPIEARQQTEAGAQAFTHYYIALINRLPATLDASPLKEFSSSCETCDRIARDAESDKAAGYTYRGGTLSITSLGGAALSDDAAELAFVVDQAPLDVLDATGTPIAELSSPQLKDLPAGLSLTWSEGHWLVSNLSFG